MRGCPQFSRPWVGWFWLLMWGVFSPPLEGQQNRVRVGAEVLLQNYISLISGKRVGIICNHTSILPNKTRLIDTLLSKGISVTALFSPEHGIRGNVPAGVNVGESIEEKTGLPVFSLYQNKTTANILEGVDVLLFDLQDVGARFFTYYITMAHAMEIAAAAKKIFIVLDRPNPINGSDIEGPVLDSSLQSPVGRFPLAIRHGLTLGEMARMIVGEKWIPCDTTFSLIVVPMEGWKRTMYYDETGLPWIAPSPNMKFLSTALVYPGTCLIEGTNLSEGRGSYRPFEYVGAPWLDGNRLAKTLDSMQIPGARFHAIKFTPKSDSIRAPNPKYNGESCSGIFLQVTDRRSFHPVITAVKMISAIRSLFSFRFEFLPRLFDRLAGSASLRSVLEKSAALDSLLTSGAYELDSYRILRARYLLY